MSGNDPENGLELLAHIGELFDGPAAKKRKPDAMPKSEIDRVLEHRSREETEAITSQPYSKSRGRSLIFKDVVQQKLSKSKPKAMSFYDEVDATPLLPDLDQSILPKKIDPPYLRKSPLAVVVKDHLDIDNSPSTLIPKISMSLFETECNGRSITSSTSFPDSQNLIVLNYGSVDGRMDDAVASTSRTPEIEKDNEKEVHNSNSALYRNILPLKREPKFSKSLFSSATKVDRTSHSNLQSKSNKNVTSHYPTKPSTSKVMKTSEHTNYTAISATDNKSMLKIGTKHRNNYHIESDIDFKEKDSFSVGDENVPAMLHKMKPDSVSSCEKKGRGRPRKYPPGEEPLMMKKTGRPRGRPRKDGSDPQPRSKEEAELRERRPRGRPRKDGTEITVKQRQKSPLLFDHRPRRVGTLMIDLQKVYDKVLPSEIETFHAKVLSYAHSLIIGIERHESKVKEEIDDSVWDHSFDSDKEHCSDLHCSSSDGRESEKADETADYGEMRDIMYLDNRSPTAGTEWSHQSEDNTIGEEDNHTNSYVDEKGQLHDTSENGDYEMGESNGTMLSMEIMDNNSGSSDHGDVSMDQVSVITEN